MTIKVVRRIFCAVLLLANLPVGGVQAADQQEKFRTQVTAIEAEIGGRVGIAVHDLKGNSLFSYKSDQRFPMSSTFKALLCGAVLARVDAGQESLERVISFESEDLVSYSPVTETHVGKGMNVAALCEATVTISDNTAGNLLLETVGGPKGFTQFLRDLGDPTTRLDRWETALNEGAPNDPRDTTTPEAILRSLNTLAFQEALSPSSRKQLRQWMIDDKVADALLRSVLPDGWRIGDKTGAGGHGARAIIAFVEPSKAEPVLIAIYLAENNQPFDTRNTTIARLGAVIFDLLQEQ